MNGGEPVLGGIKIPHGDTTAPDPGSQPALSDTNPVSDPPQAPSAAPVSTASQSPSPSTLASQPPLPPTPSPQPTQHSATPQPQANFSSFQANSQSTIPTNSPVGSATISQPIPRLTNRFSDHPIAEQPFPSPIPNSPTQGTVFNNSGNNIMLSPTSQPKKSKKWLIVTIIILLLAAVGLGAGMLISSGGNPFQPKLTKEEYEDFYQQLLEYSMELDKPYEFIKNGRDGNISFYEVFIYKYAMANNEFFGVINGEIPYVKPILPSTIMEDIAAETWPAGNLQNLLDKIQNQNVPLDIKKLAEKTNKMVPKYSDIMQKSLQDINHIIDIFINGDDQAIDDLAREYNLSANIKEALINYKRQYSQISLIWDHCKNDPALPECNQSIDAGILEAMNEDTQIVKDIFAAVVNEEDMTFINDTNFNINEIIIKIGDVLYES